MKINPNRLWIVAILLGWSFDFLFWKQDAGLNFALFLTLCLLGGIGLLLADGFRPARKSLWLLIPFFFFASITFLRQEPLTLFLAYAFSLFSLGAFVATYLGGRWTEYGLTDYFRRFFHLIGRALIGGVEFQREVRKERAANGETSRFPSLSILRGVLIATPIIAFFGFLLANADAIFQQKITDAFKDFNFWEDLLRLLIILACAYFLIGVFLHAAFHSRDEMLTGSKDTLFKQSLGFTESSIVLGSVALLFGSFVVIQFQYFFGGHAAMVVEGFTYSQYARRGFNELITVAFFSLVMIIGLGVLTRRVTEIQRRMYSGLSVVIVAEVMVILVSAYQRLMLAIDWHGFSRLRLYPRVFLIWIGILLVAIVVLETLRKERYFALAFVLASLGFGVSLTFVDVDASIVMHNIERVVQGKNLNVPHLASLSPDAIPALAEGFNNPSFPAALHEGIGAILACYLNSGAIRASDDWRSLNLSIWHADQALENVKPLLADYHYNHSRYPPRVRTPGQSTYFCVDTSGSDNAD